MGSDPPDGAVAGEQGQPATAIVDRLGRIQGASASFGQRVGREPAALVGVALAELVDLEDPEGPGPPLLERLLGQPGAAWVQLPSGRRERVQVRAWGVGPLGFEVALDADACDRSAERERLRTSEAHLRSLFENSLDGILYTSPTGQIFAANPAACRMLGRSEAEIVRVGRAGIVDSTDPRLAPFLEDRRRSGRALGEMTLVRHDGSRFPVEVSSGVFRDPSGAERTSLSFRDVTERRRAEEQVAFLLEAGALLASSLDLQTTLQSLTRLVVPRLADLCLVDLLEGQALQRVAVAHRDPGAEPEIRGQRLGLSGLITEVGLEAVQRTRRPELVPEVTEAWLRAATRNEAHFRAVRDVGPRSALLVPLLVRGEALGVLTLAYLEGPRRYGPADLPLALGLAERAALALDHARLYASAVEARQLRDEVLGIVSHDLRNPLGAISLAVQSLAGCAGAPAAAVIQRAVARADRLIADLLTVAAVEAGKLPLEQAGEPVAGLVEEALALHRPLAEGRRLALTARVEPGLPPAFVDRHRAVQLLSNLLGNALKFTPEGGRVWVEARRVGGELELCVGDTGPGIDAECMAHLFERFWQGAHAHRAGAGLGLAIVKGIAEAHHGRVWAESEVGRGALFRVRLPLVRAEQPAAAPPA